MLNASVTSTEVSMPDDAPSSTKLMVGSAFKPDSDSDHAMTMMVMLLDLQDQALPIARLRAWAMDRSRLQSGETVIDVGSGTGTMVRELAAIVGPTGRATGIEPNPRLRALAVERAAAVPNADFVDGLADHLPCDDDSIDLVWCERVLQHLPDAAAAIAEFHRVLRPGGRAILLDSDHASRVTSDIDYEVEARIIASFLAALPNPRAARLIPRQAVTAGFTVDPDIGSAALVMPAKPPAGAPSVTEVSIRNAADTGRITAAEAEDALAGIRSAAESGWAFTAVTVFGFLIVKPETGS